MTLFSWHYRIMARDSFVPNPLLVNISGLFFSWAIVVAYSARGMPS
jgi:hypothetical protein